MIEYAGYTLVEILKLEQPNNHDYTFQILKKISHKNYDEYDYQNWSQWIEGQQQRNHKSYYDVLNFQNEMTSNRN